MMLLLLLLLLLRVMLRMIWDGRVVARSRRGWVRALKVLVREITVIHGHGRAIVRVEQQVLSI